MAGKVLRMSESTLNKHQYKTESDVQRKPALRLY